MNLKSVRRETWIVAAILAAIVLLYFFRLGSLGFFDPDEGRYAAIPQAMLQRGDFVVPYLEGFPYLEKPPLLYWTTAASLAVFGHDEWAGRLPVALFGLLGIGAIFLFARKRLGPVVATAGAALLALNMQWFIQARFLTTDMVLAGVMTVGMCAFFEGAETGRRRWFALLYVCCALGTLAKGFVGFVLPGLVVLLYVALTRRWRILARMGLWWGALLGAAIALPWFLLVQREFPDFLRWFVIDQHVSRYAGNDAEHAKPFWTFVPVLWIGFFPWIMHLPFLRRRDVAAAAPAGAEDATRRLHVYLWCWFGAIFGFFTVSSGKLISYILPALPPLALLAALLVARAFAPRPDGDALARLRRGSLIVAPIWLVMAVAAIVGLPWLVVRDNRMNLADVAVWPWLFGAVFGLGGLAALVLALARRVRGALAAQAIAGAALFATMMFAASAVEPLMNPRPLGVALAKVVKPGDVVALYQIPQPSFEFYLGRPPKLIAFAGEYRYGIGLKPNPDLYTPDEKELDRLLASDRTVYVVVDKDEFKPDRHGTPLRLVVQNTKRAVYSNR